jgi:PE family
VTTEPQLLAAAAADAAGIGSTINEASAAAAGRITGVAPAAVDEVSTATATLFNAYAGEFRSLLDQAEAFHARFAQALSVAGSAYAQAEAVNAAAAANVTLVMGGSGNPNPPESYVNAVVTNYITPNFPSFLLSDAQALFTPEAFYPLTGIKDLTPNV